VTNAQFATRFVAATGSRHGGGERPRPGALSPNAPSPELLKGGSLLFKHTEGVTRFPVRRR
jgi:hypothetical protein